MAFTTNTLTVYVLKGIRFMRVADWRDTSPEKVWTPESFLAENAIVTPVMGLFPLSPFVQLTLSVFVPGKLTITFVGASGGTVVWCGVCVCGVVWCVCVWCVCVCVFGVCLVCVWCVCVCVCVCGVVWCGVCVVWCGVCVCGVCVCVFGVCLVCVWCVCVCVCVCVVWCGVVWCVCVCVCVCAH